MCHTVSQTIIIIYNFNFPTTNPLLRQYNQLRLELRVFHFVFIYFWGYINSWMINYVCTYLRWFFRVPTATVEDVGKQIQYNPYGWKKKPNFNFISFILSCGLRKRHVYLLDTYFYSISTIALNENICLDNMYFTLIRICNTAT